MSFRIAATLAVIILGVKAASAAPTLFGVGSMSASAFPSVPEAPDPLNINHEYEQEATAGDPALHASRVEFYGAGGNSMSYGGTAQFGRLSSRAAVSAGGGYLDFDISYASSLSVSFQDVLKVPGLTNGFLSLDFELDGILRGVGGGADFAAYYNNGMEAFACSAQINPGNVAHVDPVCTGGAGDVTLTPAGGGDFALYNKRTFFVPIGPDGVELFVSMRARAVCPEMSFCSADLGDTALIGNVKIYNSSFQQLTGLSVLSESGYDYITPPGAPDTPGVPEPGTCASFGGGILLILALRRRAAGQRR